MSSFMQARYTRTLLAAVDLSAKQYYYVANNGSDKYNVAGGVVGAVGAGFLMNAPEADEMCEIAANGGGAKGVAAETISAAGLELKANVLGTLENAVAGDVVVALSVQSAAASDVFEVNPVYYVKGSAVPIALLAAVDLTAGTGLYVGDNGSGAANVIGGIQGGVGYGFLVNAPDTGETAIINGPGFPSAGAIAGGTISGAKLELKANALGKLVAAVPGDTVVAISTASAVADDSISVIPVFYQKDSVPFAIVAAEDLTSGQYLYVGDDTGLKKVGGATGALGYGFLQNNPDTAESAIINGPGFPVSNAISGAAYAINTELMANAAGKLIATTAAGDIVCALSLEAASGADETLSVIPVLYRKHA